MAYSQRPSDLLEVGDGWAAYQFDLAVLALGRWVENRLGERDKQGNPKYSIEGLLREAGEATPRRSFADWRGLKGMIG